MDEERLVKIGDKPPMSIAEYIDIMSERYAVNCRACLKDGFQPMENGWLSADFWKRKLNEAFAKSDGYSPQEQNMSHDDIRRQHPHKVEDLPDEEFYAILYPESVTVPGDERSRTNPGHGYPEHSVDNWRMEVFPTREAWEAEIVRLEQQKGFMRQKYKAIRAFPAKITTNVNVE